MKARILVAVFMISSIILPAMFVPARGQLVIGVHIGDWFVYRGTLVSWVADPGVPFPPNPYLDFLRVYN